MTGCLLIGGNIYYDKNGGVIIKGIILGNGVNARLGIDQIKNESIFERFISNVKIYEPMFSRVFSVDINNKIIDSLFGENIKMGIESMAGKLYEYTKNKKEKSWSENDDMRLQDVLTCLCILSIFYDSKGLIKPEINTKNLPKFDVYNKVFTLNYKEFWDDADVCIHLHGQIDYNNLVDAESVFLYNPSRLRLPEYKKAVEEMSFSGNGVEFDYCKYIFSPDTLIKKKLTHVAGVLPSKRLFPAPDLFLIKTKELYHELDGIKELDLLGVSPIGDDSLITRINQMDKVRVFVHNLSNTKTVEKWKDILECPYEIMAASEL